METMSIVRQNLMKNVNYRPYCGASPLRHCWNPRTNWTGEQFICPNCKWISSFPEDFIKQYKEKHGL